MSTPTRRPLAEQCTRLYTPHGTVAHLQSPARALAAVDDVLCGRPRPEPDGWLGTGSQDEYDRAAQMPVCGRCGRLAVAADARHAEGEGVMTPVHEDPPVITPPGDRGLNAAACPPSRLPLPGRAGPQPGRGRTPDGAQPLVPVRGTSSSPQPPPDAEGDGCGAREELHGGSPEYAAVEPPAEDAPGVARTPIAAAPGAAIPDGWGVLVGEARLLAAGGEGALWWASYRKRQPEDRITPLDAPPGCCHVACEDEGHARWLESHMCLQGVAPGFVKALRLSQCAAVALERQEDAAGGATAMDSVRAETSRQKAVQRRGRGKKTTQQPGPGMIRRNPPGGAA